MNMNEPVASHEAEMEWAFPTVDPGNEPLGGRILVQLRRTKKKTTSAGIILVEETRETEKWNAQVAKVIKLGPLAFRNRETMEPWPEGVWVKEGDFIRAPRWGGDRWEIPVPGQPDEDPALFMVINDHESISRVTGDPLSFKAFV
jgi:co-chaperonin GroES (HSP10)